jgi:hypothetical protein
MLCLFFIAKDVCDCDCEYKYVWYSSLSFRLPPVSIEFLIVLVRFRAPAYPYSVPEPVFSEPDPVSTGCSSEEDTGVVVGTLRLAVPPGSAAIVVKNLYLSCDPYMRTRMTRHDQPSFVPDFNPAEVPTVYICANLSLITCKSVFV